MTTNIADSRRCYDLILFCFHEETISWSPICSPRMSQKCRNRFHHYTTGLYLTTTFLNTPEYLNTVVVSQSTIISNNVGHISPRSSFLLLYACAKAPSFKYVLTMEWLWKLLKGLLLNIQYVKRLERSIHLRNSNTGVNIDVTTQRIARTRDVSGGNRIATVFASVRGDLTTANYCMTVMMMPPIFKPLFHI